MAFILPDSTPWPEDGDELDDALQATVVGVTGLPGQLVRPRWQHEPPNLPSFDTNWASIGVTDTHDDTNAYIEQISDTKRLMECDQIVTVLTSFYGPRAQRYMALLKDGLRIDENRAALSALDIQLVEAQDGRQVPALFKNVWQKRFDMPLIFRRRIRRIYTLSAVGGAWLGLDNELYITPLRVNSPSNS